MSLPQQWYYIPKIPVTPAFGILRSLGLGLWRFGFRWLLLSKWVNISSQLRSREFSGGVCVFFGTHWFFVLKDILFLGTCVNTNTYAYILGVLGMIFPKNETWFRNLRCWGAYPIHLFLALCYGRLKILQSLESIFVAIYHSWVPCIFFPPMEVSFF